MALGRARHGAARGEYSFAVQAADAVRIGDACEVGTLNRRQCTAKGGDVIPLGPARRNGVTEDLAAVSKASMSGFEGAACFGAANRF
ncbi:MAG: hypothetical protein QOD95_2647 [Gammaproteobacteria bacterium]|nr:hypothetical protein [Gammaproteobacteria bacterium]